MPKKRQVSENLAPFHVRLPIKIKDRLQSYADRRGETSARVLSDLIDQHIPDLELNLPKINLVDADEQIDLEKWLQKHE